MADEEEIIATFVNGVTHVTGSTKLGAKIRQKISLLKKKTWLLSLILWTSIIIFLIWRRR